MFCCLWREEKGKKSEKKKFKSQTGLFILLESLVRGKFKQKKLPIKKHQLKFFRYFKSVIK